MYEHIDGNLAISVNTWQQVGLTYHQFRMDSQRGCLKILKRGQHGNTYIDVNSISKPERLRKIEEVLGSVKQEHSLYKVEIDVDAREFYSSYVTKDGNTLDSNLVNLYTAKASLFSTLKRDLQVQRMARARSNGNGKLKMGEWYATMLKWWNRECTTFECEIKPYNNVRSFERAFKNYCNAGYSSLLHGLLGAENARVVTRKLENLLLSIFRLYDKPFVNRVHELYNEFVSGTKELYDKETGELYLPADFQKNGVAIEISLATVWLYLKDVVNNSAIYQDRNGNFDYANSRRPKHHRKIGKFSLSKVSMDDVVLSRKSTQGWVSKYIAVDVVSGYYFRPAYIVGKPNLQTVYESFRNMFCELHSLGLPTPGEIEVEHHLMQDVKWLNDVFKFVRFCGSPTEKRAEHYIHALKYGAAKKLGQTRGRWYAKSEAYRAIRTKVSGDFVEKTYDARSIVADDLVAIDLHNNTLHPRQKSYPGMTRKEVFLKNVNEQLTLLDPAYLLQYIGNITQTSIRNNDYCAVNNEEFELVDYNSLKRLKSNNNKVTAYWLPLTDGNVDKVYLYQDGKYIGEAVNRAQYAYNECAFERTEEDKANMLHQAKRLAKYDKMIRERREELGKIGFADAVEANDIVEAKAEIVESIKEVSVGDQFEGLEDNFEDYTAKAINSI